MAVFGVFSSLLIVSVFLKVCFTSSDDVESVPLLKQAKNTVMIAVLVRNKEHTLPYFLSCIERLEYPKSRISLWLRSDHNIDNSIEVLNKWLEVNGNQYHSVNSVFNESETSITGEMGVAHWPDTRYSHLISLREQALKDARYMWADFLWMLDSDAFITNPKTLDEVISKGYVIAAPMLRSDGLYSNFWCGMTEKYYYHRTDDYAPILNRKTKGCHSVPMVHSSVLINLRAELSEKLTYNPNKLENYDGPHDDIITFALSAKMSGVDMYVCNDDIYGYIMVPLEKDDQLSFDLEQLRNLKVEILGDGGPLVPSELLNQYVRRPVEGPWLVDKTYMISLKRRPERRERMHECFKELQLPATTVDAVDGQLLTDEELGRLGVRLMSGYKDPYHKRPMKRGEIGCFLSHYGIWREVREAGLEVVMVLEDDVKFEPFFNQKIQAVLDEVKILNLEWDLIYLGRKRLHEDTEEAVTGSRHLVYAGYSYWTLGYLLSFSGASKLLNAEPLKNILPVDEYLPILYDKHPEDEWKAHFPVRDLIALSAEPLLLYPTRYLHEEGYISDTEDSPTVTTTLSPEL